MQTLTLEQTARLCGYKSSNTFRNNMKALMEQEGFPARLPSGCWYEPAVQSWLARMSGMDAPPPAISAQAAALEAFYAQGAAA